VPLSLTIIRMHCVRAARAIRLLVFRYTYCHRRQREEVHHVAQIIIRRSAMITLHHKAYGPSYSCCSVVRTNNSLTLVRPTDEIADIIIYELSYYNILMRCTYIIFTYSIAVCEQPQLCCSYRRSTPDGC